MEPLRLDPVPARVLAWHNRHPLARRIAAEHIGSMGYVALPFIRREGRRGLLRGFDEAFLEGVRLGALARWAARHGAPLTEPPAGGPLREVHKSGERYQPGDTTVTLYVRTAFIDDGWQTSRVLVGARDPASVFGPRLWSRPRQAVTGGVLAALLGAVLVLHAPFGDDDAPPAIAVLPSPAASGAVAAAVPASTASTASTASAPSAPSPVVAHAATDAAPASSAATHVAAASVADGHAHAHADDALPAQRQRPHEAVTPSPRSVDHAPPVAPAPPPAPPPASVRTPAPARAPAAELPQAAPAPVAGAPAAAGRQDDNPRWGHIEMPTIRPSLRTVEPVLQPPRPKAAAAASPASASAPAPVWALATRAFRREADSEQTTVAIGALLQRAGLRAVRVQVVDLGGGWHVVVYPIPNRVAADNARHMLAARGFVTEPVEF